MALACVPAGLAGNRATLPKEKVAEFVAEKLDVTTLPASIRPKPEKRKKTFGDYGYMTQFVDESQIHAEATPGGRKLISGSWKKRRLKFTFALKVRA